ncbi:Dual specificity protein kinase lkh1 [Termitomyces sp. T112]|nr:Dual specificity protein kinase lkh1 [Termitomyces sp. T112]
MAHFLPRIRHTHALHYLRRSVFSRQLTSTAVSEYPVVRHKSIHDGEPIIIKKYACFSEPLGFQASQGYGWPRLEFEQVIKDQWIIKRKLGWGMSSSIWLAFDQRLKMYVAVKAITGYENILVNRGERTFEFDALQAVTVTKPRSPHVLQIYAAFSMEGQGMDGNHIGFVTQLHGGNVDRLVKHHRPLPLPLRKRIVLHILRGIAHTHKHGYIHTDLKLDNIFFTTDMSTEDITSLLISDPSRRHDPEDSPSGIVQPAVSQPLPLPSLQDAMNSTFLLGDFSHAQPCSDRPAQPVGIPPHRPPESVIFSSWNEKADIWQFGCLVFELMTGKSLFDWTPLPEYNLNEDANLLYQMMTITGEQFSLDQLSQGQKTGDYFNENGHLLSMPPCSGDDYCAKIKKLGWLSDADVASTCQLLSRCLRLNPNDRSDAGDLLSDPFFVGVD